MAFESPIDAIIRAKQQKNQYGMDAWQNFASSLGQVGSQLGVGQIQGKQQQQKKQDWMRTVNELMANPNVPQQYKQFGPILAQAGPDQGMAFIEKMISPAKQTSPWRVVPGVLSKTGKPVQENEMTGEIREGSLDVTPTGRGNSNFGTGSITWDTASDEDKNLAKGLYEGRIRSFDLGYRDRSVGTKLANEYAIKNGLPPFKSYAGDVAAGTAKSFASGKFSQNVNSLNTALGHVNSAYDAYQAIGNTNQEWLNVPLNKLRTSTNDPGVIKLGITLNALQGELASVFKGTGGTDQEIATWQRFLNENLTPEQFMAAIPQIDELLRSRLSALDYQRSSGMSGRGETPLLSPKASAISKRFNSRSKKNEFKTEAEAQAANLPDGTKVTIGGIPGTWRN